MLYLPPKHPVLTLPSWRHSKHPLEEKMKKQIILQNPLKNLIYDTRQLTRLVMFVGAVLLLSAFSFAGYYYWDRYVHLGDEAPINKSIGELEKAVQADPNSPEAHMNLAETYMMNEQYPQAIEQAQQVLNSDPHNERGLFVVGLSHAFLQNYELAIGPLEDFSVIREKSSMANSDTALETALYHLGKGYLGLNRPQDAIKVLERATQINRTDADAFYQLGKAYAGAQKNSQAIASFERAVLFVPNFVEAYEAMANTYLAMNEADYVAYAQSMVAFSRNDFATAQAGLEKVTLSLPDYAPAFIGLGLTYEKLGDLKSAKEWLERAVQLEPDNFTASQALGRVLSNLGQGG
jgi:tetratricopeptide (TPR) repeat protein